MIASGTAFLTYTDQNEQDQTISANVVVPRRTLSWVPVVGGSTGQPGEIDACFSVSWDGLTASKDCTSAFFADQFFTPMVAALDAGVGYSAGQVGGTGPNRGLYFVNQMTAKMDLRTQVSLRFRNPGTTYALAYAPPALRTACAAAGLSDSATVYQANTVCSSNALNFNLGVSCIWSHEAVHMNAGIPAAKLPENDVYALWEPLVSGSLGDLRSQARAVYNAAHARVRPIIVDADSGLPTRPRAGWWIIVNQGWSDANYPYPFTCP